MPFLSQTRFPRLWLAMQKAIGGNACKQAFATEYYHSQKNILEIGCSVGNISEVFTSYPDVTFTGIDVDQQAINLAQHRFGHLPNFNFSLRSLEELADRGETFDYVIFAGILHHVNDETGLALLKDAAKCTEPGGKLVIYEPEAVRESDGWFMKIFYSLLEQGEHLRTKSALQQLVETAGIQLESIEDSMVSPGIVKRPYVARFNLIVSRPRGD